MVNIYTFDRAQSGTSADVTLSMCRLQINCSCLYASVLRTVTIVFIYNNFAVWIHTLKLYNIVCKLLRLIKGCFFFNRIRTILANVYLF